MTRGSSEPSRSSSKRAPVQARLPRPGRQLRLALPGSPRARRVRRRAGRGRAGVQGQAGRSASVSHPKVPIGNWTFSNWPLYIDKKVLKKFDKQYGGHVKYVEDINDNYEFFGKVRQQLQAEQPIGRDIVTLTDYMAARWVRNRYVEPIDKKNIPNVTNLVDNLKTINYDPKREYTLPWQSGAIGIGYNTEEDRARAEERSTTSSTRRSRAG